MTNFSRKQKLKFKEFPRKGQAIYTINEDFFREDCFITLEKVRNATAACEYIVKYLTKNNNFPLARRFSATRGLRRSARVVSSRKISEAGFQKLFGKSYTVTKFRDSKTMKLGFVNTSQDALDPGYVRS